MSESLDRAIGRLEATCELLQERMAALEKKLNIVVERTDVARGGWKTLYAVGSIGAAIGAAMAEIFRMVHR